MIATISSRLSSAVSCAGQIGAGHSIDDILADYSYLEREDILQALRVLPLKTSTP